MSLKSMNRVILIGRVGKDPEVTHIPNLGKDVAKFSLATDEGFMDRNNQWQDRTEWHNIVAWGGVVKIIERSVKKGALIAIEGKIKTNKWQDKDGNNRYNTEISLDNITLLEKTGNSGGGSYASNSDQYSNNFDQNRQPEQNNQNSYQSQSPPSVDINSDIDYSPEESGGGDPF